MDSPRSTCKGKHNHHRGRMGTREAEVPGQGLQTQLKAK